MSLKKCTSLWGEAHVIDQLPAIKEVVNARYLPFDYNSHWGIFDCNYQIVEESLDYRGPERILAGQMTSWPDGLVVEEEASEQEYIYFGRLNFHYGHFIINTLPRFWPMLTMGPKRPKILCHGSPLSGDKYPFFVTILKSLGLEISDLASYDRPVILKKLSVPATSLIEQHSVHAIYNTLCKFIAKEMSCRSVDAVDTPAYLSKSLLKAGVGHFDNEAEIEARLVSAGVDIIHPEKLSFEQQVELFSSRSLCAGTTGSAFHTAIFAAPERSLICINPTHDINSNFVLLDKLNNNNAEYYFQEGTTYSHSEAGFMTTIHAPDPAYLAEALLHMFERRSSWRRRDNKARIDDKDARASTHEKGHGEDMDLKYEHRGASYQELLKRFHDFLAPRSYLEIGTLNGSTLDLVKCAAICVDPNFQLTVSATAARPVTMLFQKTSDRFFEDYNPSVLLGCPIELAFLDGLHEAETLLRDFANVERHSKKNSVIAIHDCVPMNEEMTTRVNTGGLWTGDVWKIIPILKKYRPDLNLFVFDAGPTGLVCCTNLNPSSTVLQDNWHTIWEEWRSVELQAYGFDRLIDDAAPIWTETVKTAEDLRRYFWL